MQFEIINRNIPSDARFLSDCVYEKYYIKIFATLAKICCRIGGCLYLVNRFRLIRLFTYVILFHHDS